MNCFAILAKMMLIRGGDTVIGAIGGLRNWRL
jgi:hypothetical protein